MAPKGAFSYIYPDKISKYFYQEKQTNYLANVVSKITNKTS